MSKQFDDSNVLIADVDCTAPEGEPVCNDHDVSGYPTLKYFNSVTGKSGKEIDQSWTFATLKAFVEEELGGQVEKKCDPFSRTDCDEKQVKLIDEFDERANEEDKGVTWLFERVEELKNERTKLRADADDEKLKITVATEAKAKQITKRVKMLNKLTKKALKDAEESQEAKAEL